LTPEVIIVASFQDASYVFLIVFAMCEWRDCPTFFG